MLDGFRDSREVWGYPIMGVGDENVHGDLVNTEILLLDLYKEGKKDGGHSSVVRL